MEKVNEIVLYKPTVGDIKKQIRLLPNNNIKQPYFVDYVSGLNSIGKTSINTANILNNFSKMLNNLRVHNIRKIKIKRIFE